jgi:hypothetical protein
MKGKRGMKEGRGKKLVNKLRVRNCERKSDGRIIER